MLSPGIGRPSQPSSLSLPCALRGVLGALARVQLYPPQTSAAHLHSRCPAAWRGRGLLGGCWVPPWSARSPAPGAGAGPGLLSARGAERERGRQEAVRFRESAVPLKPGLQRAKVLPCHDMDRLPSLCPHESFNMVSSSVSPACSPGSHVAPRAAVRERSVAFRRPAIALPAHLHTPPTDCFLTR